MTLPLVLKRRKLNEMPNWAAFDCLPRDGVLIVEFAEVNRVGEGEDDGPRVKSGHGLDDVLCERVLKRVSMTKATH